MNGSLPTGGDVDQATRAKLAAMPNAASGNRPTPPPDEQSGAEHGIAGGRSHPTDSLGLIDEQLPPGLREPLRYMLGRLQVDPEAKVPGCLAVTSALHGEGVTTISRTLASLMANDLNTRVCWVDLSWSRSTRAQELSGPAGQSGLVDVLAGTAQLGNAVQATRDSRLSILPAGNLTGPNATRFARSPHLQPVMEQLAQHFDHIIIDMPPILAGSEGLGLMRLVDAYLLVVRYGVTTNQQIKTATDGLSTVPSLGVVVNRFKSRIPRRLSHFFA